MPYIITALYNNKEQNPYINEFTTKYDENNIRMNKYVDIRYCEIKLTFNENKIIGELLVHVAGDFELPQGIIRATLNAPGFLVNDISLLNTYLKVDNNFKYGFPDASKIFTGKFVIDQNDEDYFQQNPNTFFKMFLTFSLNTDQLDGLEISSNKVNQFISNLSNINLAFNVDLRQQDTINSDNGLNQSVNQITSLKLINEIKPLIGNNIPSTQTITYQKIYFIFQNYENISTSFKNIFLLKKIY